MARVWVEVRPGMGVGGYSVFVDGLPPEMDAGHRGEARCHGRCGDGSLHSLLYSFYGAPGAALSIILRCGGRVVCRLAGIRIAEQGTPRNAGRTLFEI